MSSFFLFPYFVSLICSVLLLVPSQSRGINHNTNHGFSISLIHRDSPQSPFYNNSMTTYQRRAAAARRSVYRQRHLMSLLSGATATKKGDLSTKLFPEASEYLSTIYIGTPPTKLTVFIDTATELTWVKGPSVFDSKKSSTYREYHCSVSSSDCPFSSISACNKNTSLCGYELHYPYPYPNLGSTRGIVAFEDFGFDDPNGGKKMVEFGNFIFGYNFNNTEKTFTGSENGALALNMGPKSFISQLGVTKFSHCLSGNSGIVKFGSGAVISNVTTPMVPSKDDGYHVNIKDFRVTSNDNASASVSNQTLEGIPDVMIDMGTTYTALDNMVYVGLTTWISGYIKAPKKQAHGDFNLCFEGTYKDLGNLPELTCRLDDGVDLVGGIEVKFPNENIYVEVSEGVLCLAMVSAAGDPVSILGSYQLRNIWVGYDISGHQISFTPANNCAVP